MQKANQILKDVFGYDSFRPLQSDIIQNILNKKDTLVIMPTGGGKSLCYQIPALIFEGLTVVVSPLISLMKDQVEQLRQLGVNTALLNSSLPRIAYNENFERVENKQAKLLYIAPESLVKDEIAGLLKGVKLDCITVDEAHCISEWGHDFRKDYRLLGNFRAKFPDAVCIGLTATATPRVQEDIDKNLNMIRPQKFIASFNRENLFLQVVPKRNSFQQTVDFLKEHPNQSGIIYCFSRKQVDDLSENLAALGFSSKPYHAGLTDEERNINQDLFIKDEAQVIVATIAFGMGINKSNVRFVLHHDLPKNIESYYQEIGRSGRDGLKADCLLLFSYGDISKINYFIDQKEDEIERQSAKMHLNAMVKYAESEMCRRHPLINYFGEPYKISNCGMCDNCVGDERERTDITTEAQKFLSAVKRTGEIFGANYIIDVLLGVDSDRIFHNKHQNLSVYGIGKEYNKKQWHTFVNQFISKEIITRDIEFGSLKLSEKANDVLFKNNKVFGFVKEPEAKKFKEVAADNYDKELFEILRKKRKYLAAIYEVPPYVIFSDYSLIQMAVEYPTDEQMFLNISGVGRMKLESYGEIFISLIKDYCAKKNIGDRQIRRRKRKSINTIADTKPRYMIVSESYNNGKSIDELAKEYDVKPQTIIGYLERYANLGNTIRMDGLLKRLTIPEEDHQKVFCEFDLTGSFSLKSAFEKFNGKISYEELQILRILYNIKIKKSPYSLP